MITVTPYPDRAAWLAARRGTIGGTTAAAILGVSPWSSPWSVYAREVLGQPDDGPGDEIAQRGLELEPVALARWARAGRLPAGCEPLDSAGDIVTVRRADLPGWLASPDALVVDSATREIVGGVEVKTVSRSDLGRFWSDDDPEPAWVRDIDGRDVHPDDDGGHVPPGWLVQMLVYIEITGAKWWDLNVLGPHIDQTAILRIWRDEATQRALVERCNAWWSTHIEGRTPPPVDGSEACARALLRDGPRSGRHRMERIDDPELDTWAAAYVELGQRAAAANDARAEARNHLIAVIGDDVARVMTTGHTITIDKRGSVKVTARKA